MGKLSELIMQAGLADKNDITWEDIERAIVEDILDNKDKEDEK